MNGGEPIGTPIPILGASLGLSGCQKFRPASYRGIAWSSVYGSQSPSRSLTGYSLLSIGLFPIASPIFFHSVWISLFKGMRLGPPAFVAPSPTSLLERRPPAWQLVVSPWVWLRGAVISSALLRDTHLPYPQGGHSTPYSWLHREHFLAGSRSA